MVNDKKGYCDKPVAGYVKSKSVGQQGAGQKDMQGPKVDYVSNPKGIEPRKLGSMKMGGMQGPVQPKVGK